MVSSVKSFEISRTTILEALVMYLSIQGKINTDICPIIFCYKRHLV